MSEVNVKLMFLVCFCLFVLLFSLCVCYYVDFLHIFVLEIYHNINLEIGLYFVVGP
jgi:hypothetical protein